MRFGMYGGRRRGEAEGEGGGGSDWEQEKANRDLEWREEREV